MVTTMISRQYTVEIPEEFRAMLSAGEEVAVTVDEQVRMIITPVEKIRALLLESFGMWADRTDVPADGIEYVDEIRKGHRLDVFRPHPNEID